MDLGNSIRNSKRDTDSIIANRIYGKNPLYDAEYILRGKYPPG